MTFGSLFSGIGGFDLGFERAEMRCVWQVENDRRCCEVLERHWPHAARFGDVREWSCNRGEHSCDVICGGFPCQDLSVAGKRAGLQGDRSGLFWHVIRVASILRPRFLVLENVPGLLSSNGGRDMGAVVGAILDAGYSCAWRVLDSQWFGLAQRRKRVFIVGHSDAACAAAVLFEPEGGAGHPATVRKAGQDIAYSLGASTGGVSAKEQQQTLVGYALRTGAHRHSEHAFEASVSVPIRAENRGGFNSSDEAQTIIAHTLRVGGRDRGAGDSYDNTPIVSHALNAHGGSCGRIDGESETFIPVSSIESVQQQRSDDGGSNASRRGSAAMPNRMRETPGLSRWLDAAMPAGTDGRRYRMLGNAVSVPVAEWIGRKIMETEGVAA